MFEVQFTERAKLDIEKHKKAGNKDKLNEVSKLMEDAKSFIGLKKVQTKIDAPEIDEYFKNIDKKTSELIENFSSASIYECLILGENIFPKASMLEEFYKSPIQELVTTITFDSNSNISIGNYKGFNSYQIYFNAISIQYLNQIFLKGQNNSKINYESLKDYFENYTWYSLINNVIKPNSSDCSFKWLDFILPPLELFFEQSEKDIKNGINSKEQYILIIDSLALKFEGVLRDFSNRIGAQIIEANELNTEMRIDFEKLFENEKFKELVPEYDVAFFKYLFTRKGLNIRNNVAHSFYTPNDYSVSIIWLLICAYLKLGNFEFKVNKKDGEQ